MRYQPDRDRGWRSWLITTAKREAWRLHRKEAAHIGFEVGGTDDRVREPVEPDDTLAIRADLRAAMDLLAAVPERRRQAEALQVMGYSLDEIGQLLGFGRTRANALVAEANVAMRREHLRVAPEQQPRSARAARLRELEEEPPRWLHAAIGRPPGKNVPAEAVLAWRRAALAVDDYRRDHAPALKDEPLGERPDDPRAARAYELASRAATRAREARLPRRQRSLER